MPTEAEEAWQEKRGDDIGQSGAKRKIVAPPVEAAIPVRCPGAGPQAPHPRRGSAAGHVDSILLPA